MNNNWSQDIDFDSVCRRAGGRRLYNSVRQVQAAMRRKDVLDLMAKYGDALAWGVQSQIARKLGVSRSTICRDYKIILAQMNRERVCPLCGYRTRR